MQEKLFSTMDSTVENESKTGQQENKDFVFRFPLDPGHGASDPDTTLRFFFRDQILDLLKVVSLSKDGNRILPNEFSFLNAPDKTYPLFEDE